MLKWENDDQLFSLMKKELYSSVIGDILDKMHYLHQFLPHRIQAMHPDMVVAGRAMPVLEADAFEEISDGQNSVMKKNFGLMLEALDDLKKNEVCIGWRTDVHSYETAGFCGGGRQRISPRHAWNFRPRFSLFFLRTLCTGSRTARKGN
mgnify:CR=1 FL=1